MSFDPAPLRKYVIKTIPPTTVGTPGSTIHLPAGSRNTPIVRGVLTAKEDIKLLGVEKAKTARPLNFSRAEYLRIAERELAADAASEAKPKKMVLRRKKVTEPKPNPSHKIKNIIIDETAAKDVKLPGDYTTSGDKISFSPQKSRKIKKSKKVVDLSHPMYADF
jgi:hypothetical protein